MIFKKNLYDPFLCTFLYTVGLSIARYSLYPDIFALLQYTLWTPSSSQISYFIMKVWARIKKNMMYDSELCFIPSCRKRCHCFIKNKCFVYKPAQECKKGRMTLYFSLPDYCYKLPLIYRTLLYCMCFFAEFLLFSDTNCMKISAKCRQEVGSWCHCPLSGLLISIRKLL